MRTRGQCLGITMQEGLGAPNLNHSGARKPIQWLISCLGISYADAFSCGVLTSLIPGRCYLLLCILVTANSSTFTTIKCRVMKLTKKIGCSMGHETVSVKHQELLWMKGSTTHLSIFKRTYHWVRCGRFSQKWHVNCKVHVIEQKWYCYYFKYI